MNNIHLKRLSGDLSKLSQSGIPFSQSETELKTYYIFIEGPKDTLYENSNYWLRMIVPEDYPFKSPSIVFLTPIFHPNIAYEYGSICLDVLNSTWTPIFNFEKIFNIFIPQLLTYPNENDPFNQYASKLYIENRKKYDEIVLYVKNKYANEKVCNKDIVPLETIKRDIVE
jgi:ubiquitin-conjugating enzyme E2 H